MGDGAIVRPTGELHVKKGAGKSKESQTGLVLMKVLTPCGRQRALHCKNKACKTQKGQVNWAWHLAYKKPFSIALPCVKAAE